MTTRIRLLFPSPSFPLPEGEGGEPRRALHALCMIEILASLK